MKQKSRFAALVLGALLVLPLALTAIRAEARPDHHRPPPIERGPHRPGLRPGLRPSERDRLREARYDRGRPDRDRFNRNRFDRNRYDRNRYDRNRFDLNRDSKKGRRYEKFVGKRERDMRRQDRRR